MIYVTGYRHNYCMEYQDPMAAIVVTIPSSVRSSLPHCGWCEVRIPCPKMRDAAEIMNHSEEYEYCDHNDIKTAFIPSRNKGIDFFLAGGE